MERCFLTNHHCIQLANSLLDKHVHPMGWPKGDAWCVVDDLVGVEGEGKFLDNHCQNKLRFHHCKRIANANSWATAKGHVGKFWQGVFKAFRETFRVKLVWVLEELG